MSASVQRTAVILIALLVMNLSHIITEFSFGPHFPDIVQPLDYSFEITEQRGI